MTELPKQAQIANEIKTALVNGAKLTSAELCAKSHTALDTTDISRVIGDLKAAGLVAQAGTKKSTANGVLAKAWAWIGPPDSEVPKSSAHRKPVAKAVESIEDEAPVVPAPEPVVATAIESTHPDITESPVVVLPGTASHDRPSQIDHAKLAIRALSIFTNDNAARARATFRGMTPEQMDEPYGESGLSRAQILLEYDQAEDDVESAIAWVRRVSGIDNAQAVESIEIEGTHPDDLKVQREWLNKLAEWAKSDRSAVLPCADGPTDGGDEPDRVDPIEIALADLVDQADESILSFADAMLSDHPTWVRLRQMQDDAFQLLCDYRLTRTLEKS